MNPPTKVGRRDEACPSGNKGEEGGEYMENAHVSYHAHSPFPESMVQSSPHSRRAYPSPLMFTQQVRSTYTYTYVCIVTFICICMYLVCEDTKDICVYKSL